MTTLTPVEQLAFIRRSLQDSLRDGLLYDVSLIIEGLEDTIMKLVKPGFFIDKTHQLEWSHLGEADFQKLHILENKVMSELYESGDVTQRVFQADFINSEAFTKIIGFSLHSDYAQYDGVVSFLDKTSDARWVVRLMLPPPYMVFGFKDDYEDVQDWQWDYVEAYEMWAQKISHEMKTGLSADIQVGGYSNYIQDGEESVFVAQANCDVGDAGSLYLGYKKELASGFYTFVQMF